MGNTQTYAKKNDRIDALSLLPFSASNVESIAIVKLEDFWEATTKPS
jgi:hypothetical protein